jgi:hypothetical protein
VEKMKMEKIEESLEQERWKRAIETKSKTNGFEERIALIKSKWNSFEKQKIDHELICNSMILARQEAESIKAEYEKLVAIVKIVMGKRTVLETTLEKLDGEINALRPDIDLLQPNKVHISVQQQPATGSISEGGVNRGGWDRLPNTDDEPRNKPGRGRDLGSGRGFPLFNQGQAHIARHINEEGDGGHYGAPSDKNDTRFKPSSSVSNETRKRDASSSPIKGNDDDDDDNDNQSIAGSLDMNGTGLMSRSHSPSRWASQRTEIPSPQFDEGSSIFDGALMDDLFEGGNTNYLDSKKSPSPQPSKPRSRSASLGAHPPPPPLKSLSPPRWQTRTGLAASYAL